MDGKMKRQVKRRYIAVWQETQLPAPPRLGEMGGEKDRGEKRRERKE